jgi:hypothetical protein
MPRLRLTLAITALVALAPLPAAAADAVGAWAPAVDGVSVRLVAERATFVEGGDTGRDAEARLGLSLEIKNTTAKEKKLRVMPYAAFELTWEIACADGTRWQPTFFPPGPPPPGDRSVKLVLKPGEERRWLGQHGISGFTRVDEPPPDGRWFQVLPAGFYRVRLQGVSIAGLKTPLTPGPVEIGVRPVDVPVGGLQLVLSADRPTTALRAAAGTVDPVRLTLVAVNVGKKPLRLCPRDLLARFVDYDVQGSYSSTAARRGSPSPASAADYRVLLPGERLTLTADQVFPCALGSRKIIVSSRGWYQLRALGDRPAKEACPATECWSGRISSNIVWLRVR